MKLNSFMILMALFVSACSNTTQVRETREKESPQGKIEIVEISEVKWEKLNPARGDKSPQAGTLWGDRKGDVPTGFLAKFVDGFSSPPHIHNATYRAVVIEGLVHNDDPKAELMWMPPGSFWTQPKGESHITSAKGETNIALVEIDKGPYLVKPPEEAEDTGERPVNIDVQNLVWVDAEGGTQKSYLWGSLEEDNGTFLKLKGFSGSIETKSSVFRAVVISGMVKLGKDKGKSLNPGSYFGSEGNVVHQVLSEGESVLYIRTKGKYGVKSEAK